VVAVSAIVAVGDSNASAWLQPADSIDSSIKMQNFFDLHLLRSLKVFPGLNGDYHYNSIVS